jgi:Spy/CpxP family protein refolding chaperone
MKKIITGIFAIAAFTFSAAAQNPTDQKNHEKGPGMHKMHGGPMESLNLTESQKQQMKTINEDFRIKMQALHKNDNILVKDMKAQQQSLIQERQSKIASILTPEQKTKFDQFKNNHEGMRGGREGKMGGRDRGGFEGRGDHMKGDMGNLKSELGLSDDQAAKI